MESITQDSLFVWLTHEYSARLAYQGQIFERYQEAEYASLKAKVRLRIIYQAITAEAPLLKWLSTLSSTLNIAVITRQVGMHGFELSLSVSLSTAQLAAFPHAEAELYSINKALPLLQCPGLLVMDMDSTAIEMECIDQLAMQAGVGESVAAITERAMQGELDFEQSLRQRVAQLAGAQANIIDRLNEQLPLMSGLMPMLAELKLHGWYLVLASGGFMPFAKHLQQLVNLNAVFANELVIHADKLTGEVTGQIVDAQYKAKVLDQCALQWNIPVGQRVAIGDGANDMPMLLAADLGIAFHAKPKLAAVADAHIRQLDLRALPYLLQG